MKFVAMNIVGNKIYKVASEVYLAEFSGENGSQRTATSSLVILVWHC